jgi:hypothetical protein
VPARYGVADAALDFTLTARVGLPISLCVVYLAAVRASGLPSHHWHALGTPGHFLVAYAPRWPPAVEPDDASEAPPGGDDGVFIVDPHRGDHVPAAERAGRVHDDGRPLWRWRATAPEVWARASANVEAIAIAGKSSKF